MASGCHETETIYIVSPFRHDRKPLIFQWAFMLQSAGIGSGSNPAFYTLKNEWLPVVTKRRRYIMNPAFPGQFYNVFDFLDYTYFKIFSSVSQLRFAR